MPTHIENELGLGPLVHRVRMGMRAALGKAGLISRDRLSLDPLTVNYAAWDALRHNVRSWPRYQEAPNSIEVLVSPEDWDEYWGIDAARKEQGVASYLRSRAAERGYWMSGDPQVMVEPDDTVEPGEVEIVCQFAEPVDGKAQPPSKLSNTAAHQPTTSEAKPQAPDTLRFASSDETGEACLVGGRGFRLVVRSGDCIGAVRPGEAVSPEVNVRLDAEGFPYVDAKQCTIGVLEGRWTITNHSSRGTKILRHDGVRLMLGEPVPYALSEGDVIFLGPHRPLRFELV